MLINTELVGKSWFSLNGKTFKTIYDIVIIFSGSAEVLMLKLRNARASPDLRSHTGKSIQV